MFRLKFNHKEFYKYAEDQVHSVINIAEVVVYLEKEPLTVASLSKRINPPDELAKGRSKYDIYSLVEKLELWGYINKKVDVEKYGNTRARCMLTDAGHEFLIILPYCLKLGELTYRKAREKISQLS